ncbi:MAG: helix-turn-helix transcriptional regulator [Candidatus Omnitrophota bacterium]
MFKKRGKILDVMILDLTLPAEDLNRYIFHIKQYKKDLPVILLHMDRSINKKDGEALRNLAVYGCIRRPSSREEAEYMLEDLNDILDLDMDKKLAKVEYLEKEKVFACTFKNMKTYFLKRDEIREATEDDASKIMHCAIDKDGYHFTVFLESEGKYIIPWDFILHMCEERYGYFKNKQVDGISSEEIGKRIKNERNLKKLRQEDLAKKTGIQRANIARIESGKHYSSIETLEKISEALNVPVAKLLAK